MLARYCCWVTVAFITVLTIHGKLLIELFWQHHYLVLLEWESVRSFGVVPYVCDWDTAVPVKSRLYMQNLPLAELQIYNLQVDQCI